MKYDIHPLKGVNDIEFGAMAKFVQKRMSGVFESFLVGQGIPGFEDGYPADHYVKEGVLCYYDKGGYLESMQFYEPSRPMLGGVNLLSLPVGQAISFLRRLDPDLKDYGGGREGAVSRRLNLSIHAYDMDEDDQVPVHSVTVAAPGYFDFLDERE